jgi:hypothetical protein
MWVRNIAQPGMVKTCWIALIFCMRRILPKPHIAHQLAVKQGREDAVRQASEGPLVIPCVGFALTHQPLPDYPAYLSLKGILIDRLKQDRYIAV